MARGEVSGQRFGRLVVIKRVGDLHKNSLWSCACDCGNTALARRDRLVSGKKRSCGCLERSNRLLGRRGGHGGTGTPAFRSRKRMVERRGDRVIGRWRTSFAEFVADMGERPDGHELRRLDPERRYAPGNVDWVPRCR